MNKILNVPDHDFDGECGDWLIGLSRTEFINGNYTHICDGESIINCEIIECEDMPNQVLIREVVCIL